MEPAAAFRFHTGTTPAASGRKRAATRCPPFTSTAASLGRALPLAVWLDGTRKTGKIIPNSNNSGGRNMLPVKVVGTHLL